MAQHTFFRLCAHTAHKHIDVVAVADVDVLPPRVYSSLRPSLTPNSMALVQPASLGANIDARLNAVIRAEVIRNALAHWPTKNCVSASSLFPAKIAKSHIVANFCPAHHTRAVTAKPNGLHNFGLRSSARSVRTQRSAAKELTCHRKQRNTIFPASFRSFSRFPSREHVSGACSYLYRAIDEFMGSLLRRAIKCTSLHLHTIHSNSILITCYHPLNRSANFHSRNSTLFSPPLTTCAPALLSGAVGAADAIQFVLNEIVFLFLSNVVIRPQKKRTRRSQPYTTNKQGKSKLRKSF